jgi:hypothetical protein
MMALKTHKNTPDGGLLLHYLVVALVLIGVSGCAGQPYTYQATDAFPIRERAVTQTRGGVSISASIPGEEETQAIFGAPLYERGIQPIWFDISNNSREPIRFTPTSVDRNYFSPLEVAYMHRKGFSKEARLEMESRFHDSAMPRQVPAGASRSGYVFTNASSGTRSFNVDLFSSGPDYSFAFFLTPPGFVADHAEVDFNTLYSSLELTDTDLAGARGRLLEAPLVSTDQSGQTAGRPVSLVIVGNGLDVLKALLRAGWYESPGLRTADEIKKAQYMYGRPPDAIFRIQRNKNRDRNKLLLWLSPIRLDGEEVWLAQIAHFIGQRTRLEQAIFGARLDPNIDEGRDFFLQNVWYSQSLEQISWLKAGNPVPIESALKDFNGNEYFTDGNVAITWLSGEPVSQIETRTVD